MTASFQDEMFKNSRSILANILKLKVHPKFHLNKTPTQALTPPAEKKIDKIDTYYATAQAVVNIKVAIIFILFLNHLL